eukprot:sb/3472139/
MLRRIQKERDVDVYGCVSMLRSQRMQVRVFQELTETSKQPIRTRYLGHVTGYQPIRDQYFMIRSVPGVLLLTPHSLFRWYNRGSSTSSSSPLCLRQSTVWNGGGVQGEMPIYGVSRDMPIYGVSRDIICPYIMVTCPVIYAHIWILDIFLNIPLLFSAAHNPLQVQQESVH